MKILIGTNNPHKVDEMRFVLRQKFGNEIEIVSPSSVPNFPKEIEETGLTLEENAFIKAMAIFSETGIPCVADDTGLEVNALHGAPGVFSARYSGENATYQSNREKLLIEMKGVPQNERTARFRTVICYCDSVRTLFAEGICEGEIIDEERGFGGFGYDSIFIPSGFDQTFAEIAPEIKNKISHRGKALENFATRISHYS